MYFTVLVTAIFLGIGYDPILASNIKRNNMDGVRDVASHKNDSSATGPNQLPIRTTSIPRQIQNDHSESGSRKGIQSQPGTQKTNQEPFDKLKRNQSQSGILKGNQSQFGTQDQSQSGKLNRNQKPSQTKSIREHISIGTGSSNSDNKSISEKKPLKQIRSVQNLENRGGKAPLSIKNQSESIKETEKDQNEETKISKKSGAMKSEEIGESSRNSVSINHLIGLCRSLASCIHMRESDFGLDSKRIEDIEYDFNMEILHFETSKKTKEIYEARPQKYIYGESEEFMKATFHGICKQLASVFPESSKRDDIDPFYSHESREVESQANERSVAASIGFCRNTIPFLNILLGPQEEERKYFFISTAFKKNKIKYLKLLQHFYTTENQESIKIFPSRLFIQDIVINYLSKEFSLDKAFSYPTLITNEVHLDLYRKPQPEVTKDNVAIRELCQEISTISEKYNSHGPMVYKGSQSSDNQHIKHNVRLFRAKKFRRAKLYGICKYENMSDVYVYFGRKTDFEEIYLLAVKVKSDEYVALDSLSVLTSNQIISF